MSAYSGNSGTTFSFSETELDSVDFLHSMSVVGVSGSGPNVFGHGLLCVRGYYFHVDQAGFGKYPKWMDQKGFERYLKENNKKEWFRCKIKYVPNPQGAMHKLKQLLKTSWVWGIVPHNCVAFAEAIVQAGGSKIEFESNLPLFMRLSVKGVANEDAAKMQSHLLY